LSESGGRIQDRHEPQLILTLHFFFGSDAIERARASCSAHGPGSPLSPYQWLGHPPFIPDTYAVEVGSSRLSSTPGVKARAPKPSPLPRHTGARGHKATADRRPHPPARYRGRGRMYCLHRRRRQRRRGGHHPHLFAWNLVDAKSKPPHRDRAGLRDNPALSRPAGDAGQHQDR